MREGKEKGTIVHLFYVTAERGQARRRSQVLLSEEPIKLNRGLSQACEQFCYEDAG